MNTITFTLRRIGYGLIMMLCVVVLNFLLIQLAPGDPAEVIAGEMGGITEEILASIRKTYGLDLPITEQLRIYLVQLVSGNLGVSYFYNLPVSSLILARLGPTILLILAALAIAITLGVALGVIAAKKPHGWLSAMITTLATVGYALPVFWTGIMLIILFASIFPILPVEGMRSVRFEGGTLAAIADVVHHLVLPATTLAIIFMAQYARLARSSMIEILGADYVRTARAKGVPERYVIWHHALRNALLPIITVAGLQFGNLVSGAVLIETVFNWPGMGRLAFDSVLRRDHPTLLGVMIITAAMVIIANIITDFCYRIADPRIRIGSD